MSTPNNDRLAFIGASLLAAVVITGAILLLISSGFFRAPSAYAEAHATDSYGHVCPYTEMHETQEEMLACPGVHEPSQAPS
jgi:hypothetical protein